MWSCFFFVFFVFLFFFTLFWSFRRCLGHVFSFRYAHRVGQKRRPNLAPEAVLIDGSRNCRFPSPISDYSNVSFLCITILSGQSAPQQNQKIWSLTDTTFVMLETQDPVCLHIGPFSSVLHLGDDDPDFRRLTRYNDHHLTREETERLFVYCGLLNPIVLLDKCIFHSDVSWVKAHSFILTWKQWQRQSNCCFRFFPELRSVLCSGTGIMDEANGTTCQQTFLRFFWRLTRTMIDSASEKSLKNHASYSAVEVLVLAWSFTWHVKWTFSPQELCGDSGNNFFELSAVQTRLAVTDSVLIGGQTRRVHEIMTLKMGWLDRNWKQPMEVGHFISWDTKELREGADNFLQVTRVLVFSPCVVWCLLFGFEIKGVLGPLASSHQPPCCQSHW